MFFRTLLLSLSAFIFLTCASFKDQGEIRNWVYFDPRGLFSVPVPTQALDYMLKEVNDEKVAGVHFLHKETYEVIKVEIVNNSDLEEFPSIPEDCVFELCQIAYEQVILPSVRNDDPKVEVLVNDDLIIDGIGPCKHVIFNVHRENSDVCYNVTSKLGYLISIEKDRTVITVIFEGLMDSLKRKYFDNNELNTVLKNRLIEMRKNCKRLKSWNDLKNKNTQMIKLDNLI